jgi:hypothetical protein
MEGIARRGLHHLRDDYLGVTSHQVVQGAVCSEFVPERAYAQHLGVRVGHLHKRVARCNGIGSQESFDAEHAFIPDRRGFDRRTVREQGDNRHDAAIREIHLSKRFTSSMKDLLRVDGHGFQMGREAAEVFGRQRGEQLILRASISGRWAPGGTDG